MIRFRGAEFFSRLANNTQENLKCIKIVKIMSVTVMAQLSNLITHQTSGYQSHGQKCSVLLQKEIEKKKDNV